MINKSNDLPSFVNETNLPKIVDKLTYASNIKIANNKYGNRVQTVIDKIVEKADDVTKAIKQEVVNDSYSFKVGTGDVDVSADVEDGFGEVGIKGVTYQNILRNDSKNSKQFVQKDLNARVKSLSSNLIKQSTKYTLVFDITQINLEGVSSIGIYIQGSITNNAMIEVARVSNTGRYRYVFTSSSNPITSNYFDIKGHASQWENDSTTVGRTITLANVMLIEGDITIPQEYFEGIVGVGDKSKNLFNYKLHDSIEYNGSYYTITKERWKSNLVEYEVEPNTDYTISIDRYDGALWVAFEVDGVEFNNKNYDKFSKVIRTNETGKLLLRVGANNSADVGHKFINLQLKKGTVATTYEPHHDGHKIEILSNGKNLFSVNKNKFTKNRALDTSTGNFYTTQSGDWYATLDYIPLLGFKIGDYLISSSSRCVICFYDSNKNYLGFSNSNATIKSIPQNSKYYRIETHKDYLNNFQIEIINTQTPTPYECYKEDKTQILLDEPLMRLPSGVCDEITRDGKLIRRVGKIVFTGIESWNLSKTSDKTILFEVGVSNIKIDKGGDILPICDKLLASLQGNIWINDIEGVSYTDSNSNRFRIRINKNRLDTQDLTGFKKWLSQNPVTVYYELSTPVITELPAPCLRIFKDGHLTFNTLVAPESSHVVQLNKSAQIQNAIKESQSLDNRINVLENNYDNLMLSTMSRLNDLELNYTLK